jgi:hypothetical protein
MTPPSAATGRAYLVRDELKAADYIDPRYRPMPEPKLGDVLLDRWLGVDPDAVVRACSWRGFSAPSRLGLHAKYAGLRAAHERWSGVLARSANDVLRWYTGGLDMAQASKAVTGQVKEFVQSTTQFAEALGQTLQRYLLSIYPEAAYHEESLAGSMVVRMFRPVRLVRASDPGPLPLVAENSEFLENPTALSTQVVVMPGPAKYGMVESITLESLRNDDIDLIRQRWGAYARAIRRQRAAAVWNLWVSNAVFAPDSTAWFHASHGGNLLSTALSETSLKTAVLALMNQPRYGSTELSGLEPRFPNVWLVVPPALMDIAFALNKARGGTGADSNWPAGLFGPANERILVNPLLTDPTDWSVYWDASLIESVRIAYVDTEEPTVTPHTTGSGELFRKDVQQYRISQAWTVAVSDFRAAVKSTVA